LHQLSLSSSRFVKLVWDAHLSFKHKGLILQHYLQRGKPKSYSKIRFMLTPFTFIL
jgi:hypothetical protein